MCIHVVLNSVSYIWFYFLNILSFHNLQFYSLTVFFLTSKISLLFWNKNVNTSNSSFHHLELIDGERNTILDSSGIRSFSISSIVFSKAIFTAWLCSILVLECGGASTWGEGRFFDHVEPAWFFSGDCGSFRTSEVVFLMSNLSLSKKCQRSIGCIRFP